MELTELRRQYGELCGKARLIFDKATVEKRSMSKDEDAEFDKYMAEADGVKAKIETLEKRSAQEKRIKDAEELANSSTGRRADPNPSGNGGESRSRTSIDRRATEEYRSMFNQFLIGGFQGLGPTELRALDATRDTQAGYLVTPVQFLEELIKAVDDQVFLRQLATKYTVTEAKALGVPSLDADPADADWTTELLTGSEDSTMAFGKRELNPNPCAKRIKVSQKLLRMAPRAEDIVRARLAYKFGITEEKAFLLGTGVSQPLGLFVASDNGVPTSRDVVTGSSTSITADGLIDALYTLKAQYQKTAIWLFHRDAIKIIRKLKDTTNQYLWQPGLQGGQPDRILDRPFYMSEYVPNTFTTGLYVGMLFDPRFYWIVDALTFQIQRLNELYAETNQVGFIARKETDGMPVLAEAFVRIKTS